MWVWRDEKREESEAGLSHKNQGVERKIVINTSKEEEEELQGLRINEKGGEMNGGRQ